MSDFVPLSVPNIGGNEWEYVRECLDTGWVSSAGRFVVRFEEETARYVGTAHAVACASGTAALHTALLVSGVGAGDEVLVPTLTFVSPVNAVRYCGAEPVFGDADRYFNLDPVPVLAFLEERTEQRDGACHNRGTGRRVGALLTVAVFGNAGDWSALYDACRARGVAVIEDATEALGTRCVDGPWAGRHAGATADLACFSYNGNKIITTGGGGMLVTDDGEKAARARYLTQQAKDDPVASVHDTVGYNYRMTNVAAALGVAQLERLEEFVAAKERTRAAYAAGLADLGWGELSPVPGWARNNLWMQPLYVTDGPWRGRARELVDALGGHGVESRPVWRLNHLQKPFAGGTVLGAERAADLVANTVMLPSSTGIGDQQIERVCHVIHDL